MQPEMVIAWHIIKTEDMAIAVVGILPKYCIFVHGKSTEQRIGGLRKILTVVDETKTVCRSS